MTQQGKIIEETSDSYQLLHMATWNTYLFISTQICKIVFTTSKALTKTQIWTCVGPMSLSLHTWNACKARQTGLSPIFIRQVSTQVSIYKLMNTAIHLVAKGRIHFMWSSISSLIIIVHFIWSSISSRTLWRPWENSVRLVHQQLQLRENNWFWLTAFVFVLSLSLSLS